jgi:hypothetical protein
MGLWRCVQIVWWLRLRYGFANDAVSRDSRASAFVTSKRRLYSAPVEPGLSVKNFSHRRIEYLDSVAPPNVDQPSLSHISG